MPEVPTTRRTSRLATRLRIGIELLAEVGLQVGQVARTGWIVGQELLAEPRDADLHAVQRDRLVVLAEDELDAAAADVDDQGRLAAQIDGVADAEVDQPRFLASGNDLHAQADFVPHALNEVAAVGGLAHGAGGDGLEAHDTLSLSERAEGGQRAHAVVHRLGREAAVGQRAVAEPHHVLGAVQHAETAVRLHLSNHHVDGVAADVDCSDAHASCHHPTTSSQLLSYSIKRPHDPSGFVTAVMRDDDDEGTLADQCCGIVTAR